MSGRRGLTLAALAVVAGAGLVLLGASRVWWVQTVPQPAPLRPEEIAHTGGSLAPMLPALGLVALAGAGGLLATRGMARRLVGALLGVVGVTLIAVVVGVLRGASPAWPATCLLGAAVITVAGALAVRDGGRWPVMGARYGRAAPHRSAALPESSGNTTTVASALGGDRRTAPAASGDLTTAASAPSGDAPTGPAGEAMPAASAQRSLSAAELWDAVDRGDDPTRT